MATEAEGARAFAEGRRYRHIMTRYDLFMMALGTVIGSGWLFGSMFAAQFAGPAALLSWLIAGVLFLLIEWPFAEMAAMFPESGAPARVPQFALGSFGNSMNSWLTLMTSGLGVAIECLAIIQYAGGYLPGLFSLKTDSATPLGLFVTALLMLVFTMLNVYGVRIFSRTVTYWTTIKWVVPSGAMILLIISGFIHGGGANLSLPSAGGFMPYGFEPVLTAVAVGGIIYAYSGPRSAMAVAAEGRNPKRDVPFALLASVGFALILYTGLQLAFLVAVPHSALAHGWAHINFTSPLAQLAIGLGLGWLGVVLYVDGALSPGGVGLIITGTSPRGIYAVDKNGYGLPSWLMRLSRRGVPLNALWVSFVYGLICILPFPSWHALVVVVSGAGILSYMTSGSCLGILRKHAADIPRPFSTGRHARWLGPTAMAVSAMMFLWYGWPTTMQVGIFFLVGLALYVVAYYRARLPRRDIQAGLWLPVLFFAIVVLSWLGSFGTGNLHVIAFPWDTLIAAAMGVASYYWAVASSYETDSLKEMKVGRNTDFHPELVEQDIHGHIFHRAPSAGS
jgi:amino acid transporter